MSLHVEFRSPTDPHPRFPRFLEDLGIDHDPEHAPRQYVYMLEQRIQLERS
jgi:hypothetical protein